MPARDYQHNGHHPCFIILIICLFGQIIAIPTPIRLHSNERAEQWEHVNKTCQITSGDCDETISIAHWRDMKQHMRADVQPCDNFYEYACGNWNQDEKYRHSVNMMKYGNDVMVQQLVQLFTQAQLDRQLYTDPVFDKLLNYYNVCQRTEQKYFGFSLRGFAEALHALGVWNASDSWLDTLARLGRYGYASHYVKLEVLQRNASEHEVQISPHDKQFHVKLDTEIFNIIKFYTSHTYESLEKAFEQLEKELETIVNNAVTDCSSADYDDENECDLYKYYTYDQLLRTAPTINWERFIGLQLGRVPQPTDVFGVDSVRTIERVAHYLNNMNSELRRIYTFVRFLNYLQPSLKLLRTPQANAANIRCVRHMRKTLYLPMLYIYERNFYASSRADNDRTISNVFEKLKAEFSLTLNRNEMNLTDTALEFLHAKLSSLRLNTGNMPQNVTEQFYVDYISSLNVSGNFYLNHLFALQHYYAQVRQLLLGGRDQHPNWYTFNCHSPNMSDNVDSTAYYFVLSNMIVMPYAYLQKPFFDAQFWPALLYGDLANTLGHEMMHAFDSNFLGYDYAGNMVKTHREICQNAEFRRRLNNLTAGTHYVTERIADISGSNLALRTFLHDKAYLQHNGKLYFLQFAQFFCGNEANISQTLLDDPYHDRNSVRLNYVLSQVAEFSEVFECPIGSAMRIENRHIFW